MISFNSLVALAMSWSDRGRVKCGWLRLMDAHYAQALHCYRPHQEIGLGLNDDLQRNC
jgi:hypothetical protein